MTSSRSIQDYLQDILNYADDAMQFVAANLKASKRSENGSKLLILSGKLLLVINLSS